VLLNACCTMCTWSAKPISTVCDQRYLHVLRKWACQTAHPTKPRAFRDRRSLTSRVGSPHGINTYLALSRKHAKAFNKTNCWVCTKIPHSAVTGIPLLAIPFNLSEWCGYWAKEKNWEEQDNDLNNHIFTNGSGNCLRQRNFSNWFWPNFNLSKMPPYFMVERATGKPELCLVQEALGERRLGNSECSNYVYENHTMGPQVALNNTYFVCGNRAYPWLPVNWSGSCFLSFILPHMRLLSESPFEHLKRDKRSFTATELFFMILNPHYGVGQTSVALIELAASLESLANKTALGMVDINSEVVALRAVAMQNRVALDLILAAQGGTCAVINSECCTYIPDNSEKITNIADKIKQEGAKFHNYFTKDGLYSWFEGIFGGWGTALLHWISVGLLWIIIIVVLVRCATITMPALIVSCLKRNTAKKVMVAQAPPSDIGFEIESYDSYEIEPELGNP